jgi:hypothetical protein
MDGPWQHQPTCGWLYLASRRQNLAGIKGLIGRRRAMHANGAGELEAAFYHEP